MIPKRKKFSIVDRAKSFVYAYRGIVYCLKTQHNAWIHMVLTLLVIFFGFFFRISLYEWMILILCIGFVLAAEVFNTAVEEIVNWLSPEFHIKAGLIKDLASGAVLLAAISAALVGLIIFLPRFWMLFMEVWLK